jgi:hypothetical protein
VRKSQVTTLKAREECGLGRWKLKEVQFDSLAHSLISLISKQHKELERQACPMFSLRILSSGLGEWEPCA